MWGIFVENAQMCHFLEHKTVIDLTVSSTLKKPSNKKSLQILQKPEINVDNFSTPLYLFNT